MVEVISKKLSPEFWNIDAGNVITIVSFLVAFAFMYGSLKRQVELNSATSIQNLERLQRIDENGTTLARAEIRMLSSSVSRQQVQVDKIEDAVSDIRKLLFEKQ